VLVGFCQKGEHNPLINVNQTIDKMESKLELKTLEMSHAK
jgi:hypothetical protein